MFSLSRPFDPHQCPVTVVADLFYQSLMVPVGEDAALHIQRIYAAPAGSPGPGSPGLGSPGPGSPGLGSPGLGSPGLGSPGLGPAVLMLHGSLGNGRIFYSQSGKGLAPFLARQGFDTYSVDLRGRGGGRPRVSRAAGYGQTEALLEDLPAVCAVVHQLRAQLPAFWVAHSWGGAMLMSFLARFPGLRESLGAAVFFGSKRVIRRDSLAKKLILNVGFDTWGALQARCFGYVHGRRLGFGDDAETQKFYRQTRAWLRGAAWIDSDDGFDYAAALQRIQPLPVLHFTGVRDRVMAEAEDIRRFMFEYGGDRSELRVLSRAQGARKDYGHIDILTDSGAEGAHFQEVVAWFRQHAE